MAPLCNPLNVLPPPTHDSPCLPPLQGAELLEGVPDPHNMFAYLLAGEALFGHDARHLTHGHVVFSAPPGKDVGRSPVLQVGLHSVACRAGFPGARCGGAQTTGGTRRQSSVASSLHRL